MIRPIHIIILVLAFSLMSLQSKQTDPVLELFTDLVAHEVSNSGPFASKIRYLLETPSSEESISESSEIVIRELVASDDPRIAAFGLVASGLFDRYDVFTDMSHEWKFSDVASLTTALEWVLPFSEGQLLGEAGSVKTFDPRRYLNALEKIGGLPHREIGDVQSHEWRLKSVEVLDSLWEVVEGPNTKNFIREMTLQLRDSPRMRFSVPLTDEMIARLKRGETLEPANPEVTYPRKRPIIKVDSPQQAKSSTQDSRLNTIHSVESRVVIDDARRHPNKWPSGLTVAIIGVMSLAAFIMWWLFRIKSN